MCLPVSFLKRFFKTVCLKTDVDDLKNSHALDISEKDTKIKELEKELESTKLYLKGANETLYKVNEDLDLAKEKIKFHNELLEEHRSLRERYESLNARIHKSVTSITLVKKDDVPTKPENIQTFSNAIIERVLNLKYTQKKSYAAIAKITKLSEDTIKDIINKNKAIKKP